MIHQPDSRTVFTSFWQRGFDCVSIALIKAAADKYGLFKIVRKRSRNGAGCTIQLRNGAKIILTTAELNQVSKRIEARFQKPAKMAKAKFAALEAEVRLLYAVIAKQMFTIGYIDEDRSIDKPKAFEEAITWVFEGLCTDHAPRYLGLKRSAIFELSKKRLPRIPKKGVIAYSAYHAVALSAGYYDYYGDLEEFERKPELNGEPVKWWYYLK